jgi:hypothetical protein
VTVKQVTRARGRRLNGGAPNSIPASSRPKPSLWQGRAAQRGAKGMPVLEVEGEHEGEGGARSGSESRGDSISNGRSGSGSGSGSGGGSGSARPSGKTARFPSCLTSRTTDAGPPSNRLTLASAAGGGSSRSLLGV